MKQRFNNVQLLVQPYIFSSLAQLRFSLFNIPALQRGFAKLIKIISHVPG